MFSGKIAVSLGFNCNFKCAHCANCFEKRERLSPSEKKVLTSAIDRYHINVVHFIGGEPTLYIEDINEILCGIKPRRKLKVVVTTNGSFAKNLNTAISVLRSISGLSKIQLSYDKFHSQFLPFSHVKNVFQACKRIGLDFGVLSAIETPVDMFLINKLHELGNFPILIQKVLPQGSARINAVSYKAYPHFDRRVLRTKCPDRKDLLYICGKGFTICCSSLVFNLKIKEILFKTPGELFSSNLYKLFQRHSFRELAKKFRQNGDAYKPEHSSACNLCENMFKKLIDREGDKWIFSV